MSHGHSPSGQLLRWVLLAVLVWLLIGMGGKAAYARQTAVAVIAVLGCCGLWLIPKQCRLPQWTWWVVAMIPLCAIAWWQALPLGAPHPWTVPDLAHVGGGNASPPWSIDPGASWRSATWMSALTLAGLLAIGLWRGLRAKRMADAMVVVGVVHALLALLLAAGAPDWPLAEDYRGRVRGFFVYPNHFAAFTAALVPLALVRAAAVGWPWQRVALAVLLVGAVAASASRAGLGILLIINLPLLWWLLPRERRLRGAMVGLIIAILALALVNADTLLARVDQLDGDASTLNRRTYIWQAAIPLGFEFAFGSGAGTAHLAFPRAGLELFEPAQVLHMHSDPVGVLVTYGWLGTLLVVAGFVAGVIYWWLRHRLRPGVDERWLLAIGASFGVGHIFFHGWVDHIFISEAIALQGVLLLVLAAGTLPTAEAAVVSTFRWRVAVVVFGLITLAAAVPDWLREQHRVLARDAMAIMEIAPADRHSDQRKTIDYLSQQTVVRHPDLALAQARILAALENPDLATARARVEAMAAAVARGQELTPGHGDLWLEAARIALLRNDREAAVKALQRMRVWMPAAHRGHGVLQRALAVGMAADDEADAEAMVKELMTAPGSRDRLFGPAVRRVLGDEGLHALISQQHEAISAATWQVLQPELARYGTLEDWQRSWFEATPLRLPATHVLFQREASAPQVTIRLPEDLAVLGRLAHWLHEAGLPLPKEGERRLTQAGLPWSVLAQPLQWQNEAWRARVQADLAPYLAQPWVASYVASLEAIDGLRDPHPSLSPVVLATARERARALGQPTDGLDALLEPYRILRWQTHGAAAARAWVVVDERWPAPALQLPTWSLVLINGEIFGWKRGVIPLAGYLEPGFHSVTVLRPPGT